MGCSAETTATTTNRTAPRSTACCEPLEPRQLLAATYFVSPAGNDANPGTQARPWRTIARVNRVNLNPGDRVLFQGGQRFAVPEASYTDVIENGGFESSLTSWTDTMGTAAGAASITTTPADVHTGRRALKLGTRDAAMRAQDITRDVRPGRAYTLEAWAKATTDNPSKGRAYAGVKFFKGGVEILGASIGLRTLTYSRRAFDFVAPASFDAAVAYVEVEAGSNTVWVDDVRLRDTPQPLTLLRHDSGTKSAPVVIGSYGTGRATIDGGNYTAIAGVDVQGVVIQDLRVAGTWDGSAGAGRNIGAGILFGSGLPNDAKLNYVRITRTEVRGFKWSGIRFHGRVGKAGFRDVQVTHSTVHDNGDMGIYFVRTGDHTNPRYAYRDIVVRDSKVFNNGGVGDKGSATGLGIHIGDAANAMVSRNVVHHNGMFNRYTGGGPVGIMSIDSDRVTFQYNESYANKSASGKDGGGIDFDAGTTNSVMQYNYTHDNDGPGLHVADAGFARDLWTNNVIRYNVSQNDARHGDYGAIHIYGGSAMTNFEISHNTVFLSPSTRATNSNGGISAIRVRGSSSTIRIRNNIFQTTGGILLARSDSSSTRVKLQGNAYWSSGAAFKIRWGGSTYSSLDAFRAARGQERFDGGDVGMVANPRLTRPGGGGTIGNAHKLHVLLDAYKLRADSPLRGKAIRFPAVITLPAAKYDYFGTRLPTTGKLDIGADEIV